MNYIKMIFIIYILSKVFIKCMNHMRLSNLYLYLYYYICMKFFL
ncbi:hypothetical protein PFUGPA_01352 [Plasmodium falciparum Palo Alto/Uganda]|uniref:Uncharacterized protein n=1 Tax=Plasmodium falciparum (isolate Palo Alto / Uganda) TaxID=57270 RepID=W4J4P0_PLAFP|nr:hypothetical protein PFUGPA_01352 [Plasmodium falciparum Palo Alto/Uganda]